jgi:hypothetical protein
VGPTTATPCSASAATSASRSGGSFAGGGGVSAAAGSPVSKKNSSKPPGVLTTSIRASGDSMQKACGTSRGAHRKSPVCALTTWSPTYTLTSPSST